MKKNTTLILSTVLVGAGAFLIYNRSRKAKKGVSVEEIEAKQKEQAEQQARAIARETAKNQYNSLENPNSYKNKVARVQLFIGTTPDGIVGPNTLNALKAKFPQYTFLNSTNIDRVLADIFARQNLGVNFN